jgi:hypothetical protein
MPRDGELFATIMTWVSGNQTRNHRGSALRFDAAFQLLRSAWRLADSSRTAIGGVMTLLGVLQGVQESTLSNLMFPTRTLGPPASVN